MTRFRRKWNGKRKFPIKKFLKIASWNIANFYSRIWQDKTTTTEFRQAVLEFDIFSLTETHAATENDIQIPKYKHYAVVRKKHAKARKCSGGIAVFVREEIADGVVMDDRSNGVAIVLRLKKESFCTNKDIYLIFPYIPPEKSSYMESSKIEHFEALEDIVRSIPKNADHMIMGDLNGHTQTEMETTPYINEILLPEMQGCTQQAELPSRRNMDKKPLDNHGKAILALCHGYDMAILNGRTAGDFQGQFTYVKNNAASVIDYAIVSSEMHRMVRSFTVEPGITYMTDHSPIAVELDMEVDAPRYEGQGMPNPILKFLWKPEHRQSFEEKTSQPEFQDKVEKLQEEIKENPGMVSEIVIQLNSLLLETAKECVPHMKRRPLKHKRQPHHRAWFTASLEGMRKDIQKINKIYNETKNPELPPQIHKMVKNYKAAFRMKEKAFKQNMLSELNNTDPNKKPSEFWSALKTYKAAGRTDKDTEVYIPMKYWTSFFRGLYNEAVASDFPTIKGRCYTNTETDAEVSPEEIEEAVKVLKTGKSVGLDQISGEMLKYAYPVIGDLITDIFSAVFETGQYPEAWKSTYITPLHKKGPKYDPANYRGLAIASCFGKLYSIFLNNRLRKYMQDLGIAHEFQGGFVKGRRTVDNIFILNAVVDKAKAEKQEVYAAFVDMKKAYDTVDRSLLLGKMIELGAGEKFVEAIAALYQETSYRIKDNNLMGPEFRTNKGLRQGDPLSPLLFNLFIADFIDSFDLECDPIQLDDVTIYTLQFADDILLLSKSREGLIRELEKTDAYCKQNKLMISFVKTTYTVFNQEEDPWPELPVGDENIKLAQDALYLGLNMDAKRLQMNQTINKKAERAMFALAKMLGPSPPLKMAQHLFDKLVMPILLYGVEMWLPYASPRKLTRETATEVFNTQGHILTGDKIWSKFIKHLYGLSKEASVTCLRGDMGAYPFYIEAIGQLQGYVAYVTSEEAPELVKKALEVMKKKKNSWWTGVKELLKTTGVDPELTAKAEKKSLKQDLRDEYQAYWYLNVHNPTNVKFAWYRHFKPTFGREKYVDSVHGTKLSSLLRFRALDHSLPAEYCRRKKLHSDLSLCQTCVSPDNYPSYDEFHLFTCELFVDLQAQFNIKVAWDNPDSFIEVMAQMGGSTCKYIHTALVRSYHMGMFKNMALEASFFLDCAEPRTAGNVS